MPPKEADWKCRLFASVDIVGSTAFKARSPENERSHWVIRFKDFFSEFPKQLDAFETELREDNTFGYHGVVGGQRWRIWKYVGDEVLLWTDIERHEEVCLHLHALKNAVNDYSRLLRKGAPSLGLKASAWLSNFPFPNSDVVIDQVDNEGKPIEVLDFLGSGIDLGFRVASYATTRRMTVSAGLAYLIASLGGKPKLTSSLKLAYAGRESLKGLMKNRPYPIFWIDLGDEEQTSEDKLLGVRPIVDCGIASVFLSEFFDEEADRIRPFIPTDPMDEWNAVPKSLEREWEALTADDPDAAYMEAEAIESDRDCLPGKELPTAEIRFPESKSPTSKA